MKNDEKNTGEIVIFKTSENNVSIDVRFEGETVWLTQAQLVDLYNSSKANVSEHIKHIFEEEELAKESTVRKFRTVQVEGSRQVEREVECYNLDMIISLGYRIKSKIATQFRQWATKRLNEYIRKGFTMDDERLKQAGGGDYWKELLARIRDIRSGDLLRGPGRCLRRLCRRLRHPLRIRPRPVVSRRPGWPPSPSRLRGHQA